MFTTGQTIVVKVYNMLYAETLIDKAIESCGSAAELARRMGVDRAEITKLRQGKRPLSPELAAEIADIAGDDARQAVIDSIIERNRDSRKGHLLKEILGKAVAAGVAAMCLISYSGDSISATEKIAIDSSKIRHAIHRIYRKVRQQFVRIMKQLRHSTRQPTRCAGQQTGLGAATL